MAEVAAPSERIAYRDAIAAFGIDAVPQLAEWLNRPALGFFASRVLETMAKRGLEEGRTALVNALASGALTEELSREVAAAAARLGVVSQATEAPRSKKASKAKALHSTADQQLGPHHPENRTQGEAYLVGCASSRGVLVSPAAADSARAVIASHGRRINFGMAIRMVRDQLGWAICDEHLRKVLRGISGQTGDLLGPWEGASGYFLFTLQTQDAAQGLDPRDLDRVKAALDLVTEDLTIEPGSVWTITGRFSELAGELLPAGVIDHCHADQVIIPPSDLCRSFLAGVADVSGNCRYANRFIDGRVRVRLDVLNTPNSWKFAVELCRALQQTLGIPVQAITWGHPNMGRGLREHQLNIFSGDFGAIGFRVTHKQTELEKYSDHTASDRGCPGVRGVRPKASSPDESLAGLPTAIRGRHFDAYWEVCRAVGCRQAEANGVGVPIRLRL